MIGFEVTPEVGKTYVTNDTSKFAVVVGENAQVTMLEVTGEGATDTVVGYSNLGQLPVISLVKPIFGPNTEEIRLPEAAHYDLLANLHAA